MNLGNIQKLGQQAAGQASQVSQGASDLAEQAIQSTIDQGIHIVQTVAEKIRNSQIPVNNVTIQAHINVGVVQLSMVLNVPTKNAEETNS